MTSIRGTQWQRFAAEVAEHIERYTVPQYGDEGDDIITDQSAEYCVDHAKRYLARFGRSARPGSELLDYLPKFYSREQAFSNVLRSIANEEKDNV